MSRAALGDEAVRGVGSVGRIPVSRHSGIEAFRFALCFPVIVIHIIGLPSERWQTLTIAACNAAVPFFFIASGYFNKVDRGSTVADIAKPIGRLILIYAAWVAIYYAMDAVLTGRSPPFRPRDLLTGGIAYHLWFLPALAFSLGLVGLGYKAGWPRMTLGVALGCAAMSIAFGLFAPALSLPALPGTRLLAAPLYVIIGKMWPRHGHVPRVSLAVPAAIGFWALSIGESALAGDLAGGRASSGGGGAMVYGLGCSVFALALALENYRSTKLLAALGGLSLGIYCVHLLLLPVLMPHSSNMAVADVFGKGLLTLLVATLLALAIGLLPGLWRLASYRRLRFRPVAGASLSRGA